MTTKTIMNVLKWTTLTLAGVGFISLVCDAEASSSDSAIKEHIKDDIENAIAPEQQAILEEAKEASEAWKNVKADRNAKIKKMVDAYDKENHISASMVTIRENASSRIRQIRDEIHYDDRLNDYADEFKKSLEDWDTQHEYASKMNDINRRINEEKKKYDTMKAAINLINGDDEASKETKKNLVDVATSSRDSAIKDLKDKKDDLSKLRKQVKAEFEAIRDNKACELNVELENKTQAVTENRDNKINKIRDMLTEKEEEFRKHVEAEAPENEIALLERRNDLIAQAEEIKRIQKQKAKDAFKSLTGDERVKYTYRNLANMGWKPWHVIVCGGIPIAFAQYYIIQAWLYVLLIARGLKDCNA